MFSSNFSFSKVDGLKNIFLPQRQYFRVNFFVSGCNHKIKICFCNSLDTAEIVYGALENINAEFFYMRLDNDVVPKEISKKHVRLKYFA